MSERRKSTLHLYFQQGLKVARTTLGDKTNYFVAPTRTGEHKSATAVSRRAPGMVVKASPTVALSNASAACASTQTQVKPSPSPPSGFIPFPTSTLEESTTNVLRVENVDHLNCAVIPPSSLKRPLPVDGVRRRRSAALPLPRAHAAHPHARRHHTSPSATTRPLLSPLSNASNAPTPKRAKKSKRVIADLNFAATVHRSLSTFVFIHDLTYPPHSRVAGDGTLREQDMRLVARLEAHLREQGCSVSLDGSTSNKAPESDIAMDVDIDASLSSDDLPFDSSVAPMDVDTAPLTPLPSAGPIKALVISSLPPAPRTPPPPPPSPDAPPTNPAPSAGLSPRAASPSTVCPALANIALPALAPPRIYTVPQLAAILRLRHKDRTTVRRNCAFPRVVPRPGPSKLAQAVSSADCA
ncbi:hypothetical protein FA95DRAFT_1559684 [Auriscalpium vulgare]|uniref:Uncharacterized protein n=1 Tax=Auriscalpium vulgare TaxID=40419 RepID=A0ACB8RRC7_9AGAM|nr:hypothetical protein FA95DRAFT_1559684 [Auriscalpium vulgare]